MFLGPPPSNSNTEHLYGLNAHVNQFAVVGYIS